MEIVIWILQGLLGLAFLTAGAGKAFGSKTHKEAFTHWQLPQWFRVVTGIVELAIAVLLIVGFWKSEWILYGAYLIVAVGIGGIFTHVRVKDVAKDTLPITVLGILGLILLFLVL